MTSNQSRFLALHMETPALPMLLNLAKRKYKRWTAVEEAFEFLGHPDFCRFLVALSTFTLKTLGM